MYKAMKDSQRAGDQEDEETTGTNGVYQTVVAPNPKCLGCLHYDNTRGYCIVGLYPASCGDGTQPENGYAPLVPNEEAYQEWRAKRGLQHNAPRSLMQTMPGTTSGSGAKEPAGGEGVAPDFKLQVLGDEGHMELSLRSILDGEQDAVVKSDFALHHTVEGFMSNLKGLPKEGPHRGKFITAHMNHGPFLQALQKHPQGKMIHGMLTSHLNSPKNAGPKAPMRMTAKGGYEKCMKCGFSMAKAAGCPKCKYKSLRTPLAFDSKKQADRVGGPVSKGQDWSPSHRPKKYASTFKRQGKKLTPGALKRQPKVGGAMPKLPKVVTKAGDPWAIAGAAWKKVSPSKKAKYTKQAMARHRKAGEKVHASKYENRAPREFMERLARKGGASLVEEFGHGLAGALFKARYDIRKAAAANVIHLPAGPVAQMKPKTPAGHSPVLAAVRKRQMDNPSPAAHAKARQAGGGKMMSHTTLAQHAGVKPEAIADLAHGSQHVHDFHNKVRAQFGDKVKHLTSGQIRSAYHSTGLMHSMTATTTLTKSDLNLLKAHKHGKRCCIGHTSNGKPVHSDAHGAEGLNIEEHREAGQMHDDLAQRLSDAAYGYGGMGSSRGKLPPTAFKYLQGIAEHHRLIAARHHKTASLRENGMQGITAPKPAEPFGKSLSFAHVKDQGHHIAVAPHGLYRIHAGAGEHHVIYHPKSGSKVNVGKVSGIQGRANSLSAAVKLADAHHMKMTTSKKSEGVRLNNSPTDASIAKAMMAGGGAGALVHGGLVLSPLNVEPAEALRHTMELGLPSTGAVVEIRPEPEKEKEPKYKPMVGGVSSAAWDLTNYHQ